MKKVLVEITCEDNERIEIKSLVTDFCMDLQEDISPDISFIIKEDNYVVA